MILFQNKILFSSTDILEQEQEFPILIFLSFLMAL